MAKITNSITYKKAILNLPEGTITEHDKDDIPVGTHLLQDLAERFEDKFVQITVKEDQEV